MLAQCLVGEGGVAAFQVQLQLVLLQALVVTLVAALVALMLHLLAQLHMLMACTVHALLPRLPPPPP